MYLSCLAQMCGLYSCVGMFVMRRYVCHACHACMRRYVCHACVGMFVMGSEEGALLSKTLKMNVGERTLCVDMDESDEICYVTSSDRNGCEADMIRDEDCRESPAHRAERLRKVRERNRRVLECETVEERADRLRKMRERKQRALESETAEERAERLRSDAEWQRSSRRRKTTTQSTTQLTREVGLFVDDIVRKGYEETQCADSFFSP
jgi:hypothetical protein